MAGANGTYFGVDTFVDEGHVPVPLPPRDSVTAEPVPDDEGEWLEVTNREMQVETREPSFLQRVVGATGATAAALSDAAARHTRFVTSVTGDVVAACEKRIGYPGITGQVGEVGEVLVYAVALAAVEVGHRCGYLTTQPMPAEPEEAEEAAVPQA